MIVEYLRSALRGVRRHPTHSLLNAGGLALGLATFLLTALYIQDEWSFDRFHENADDLYRVAGHYTGENGTRSFARVPPAVIPLLNNQVAQVDTGVRLQRYSGAVRVGQNVVQESEAFFADSDFFELFSFPLIAGDPATALSEPFTIVLTEATALRYFGRSDVVGQTVVVSDTLDFTVTGIAADLPAQSHLQFNALASFSSYQRMRSDISFDDLWSWGTFYSYVLLTPGADPGATDQSIELAVDAALGEDQNDGSRFDATLVPLKSIHLRSDLRQQLSAGGSLSYLIIFGVIGILVLLIAGFNFVNLATARASRRALEIGVRKSIGAAPSQLVFQFLIESVAVSLLALVAAFFLVGAVMPAFNALAGKTLTTDILLSPGFLAGGLALGVLTGLLSGAYPAFVLSGFRAAVVLKSGPTSAVGGRRLRQALVVSQFAASIFLIAGTLVASSQVEFMRNHELGIEADQVAVIPFYWDELVQQRLETLYGELAQVPGVVGTTASGDVPGRMFTSMGIWAEGMPEEESAGANALIVGPDFAEVYGLDVLTGRDFASDRPSDWDDAFMLNESAARLLGWTAEEAIGKELHMNGAGTVIGVFRDFHYTGVQQSVEPIVMAMWSSWFGYVSLRIEAGARASTVEEIAAAWNRTVPGRPFELFFLDDDFDRQYEAEVRFGRVFRTLALLAILIACLGLYGLASFIVERRVKEIGVRKVFGAGVASLAALLSRSLAVLVGLAFVVATPIGFLLMNKWLEGFASRVTQSPWPFLLAGAVAFGVALATVAIHTVRAANADPIRSLRYE